MPAWNPYTNAMLISFLPIKILLRPPWQKPVVDNVSNSSANGPQNIELDHISSIGLLPLNNGSFILRTNPSSLIPTCICLFPCRCIRLPIFPFPWTVYAPMVPWQMQRCCFPLVGDHIEFFWQNFQLGFHCFQSTLPFLSIMHTIKRLLILYQLIEFYQPEVY